MLKQPTKIYKTITLDITYQGATFNEASTKFTVIFNFYTFLHLDQIQ